MKKYQQIICPYCSSKNIAKILYGLPAFSEKLDKQLKEGKLILGGCCISDESPKYHCNDCGNEWNGIEDKRWKWVEGVVDTAEDHFKIRYGDINEVESEEFIPVALIGKGEQNTFTVEFTIPEKISKPLNRKILKEVKREIEFYSFPRVFNDPWEYAIYHCTTAANIYSSFHWGYYPKGYKGK